MTAKRTPLDRRRKPLMDPETLRMFVELESTPRRQRHSQKFGDRDYELHRRLGLGAERLCSQVSIFDHKTAYPRRGTPQYEDWERVRAVREQLLAATGLGGGGQAKAS
jgi:hypothetical protein